jgi:hypothetical protein
MTGMSVAGITTLLEIVIPAKAGIHSFGLAVSEEFAWQPLGRARRGNSLDYRSIIQRVQFGSWV